VAIVTKKINGYGPYKYRVTYSNGEHHWEYLGPVDGGGSSDGQDVTNDDGQDDGGMDIDKAFAETEEGDEVSVTITDGDRRNTITGEFRGTDPQNPGYIIEASNTHYWAVEEDGNTKLKWSTSGGGRENEFNRELEVTGIET